MVDILEETIQNSTAEFITSHRSALQLKGSQEKKIELIDALLKQSLNGDYARISIFWRPTDAGPFNKIDKMIDGRRKIRQSILEHTSYATVQQNDFGFPLTAETRMNIENMAREITNNIFIIFGHISDHVLNAMYQQHETTNGFHKKLTLFTQAKRCFEFIVGDSEASAISLNRLTQQFMRIIRTLNLTSIDMNEFNRIDRCEKNFKVLEKISETKINLPIRDLIAKLSKTIKYCSAEYDWYSFLARIQDRFGSYDIQKDVASSGQSQEL